MPNRPPPLALAAALLACGSPAVAPSAGAQGVALDLRPPSAQVAPSGTATFQAAVTGSADLAVTWTVQEGAPGGTVAAGLYTAPATPGTYHVVATSHADPAVRQSATVTMAALAVTTAVLPGGTVGTPYAASLAASGGTPPYAWTLGAGALPAGLGLSASGAVSGTPTATGTAAFTVRVSDAAGGAVTRDLSIAVAAASPIDQSILPAAFRTTWNPGIPGGIPADDDPVRPATVWVPTGDPYGGFSVNPALAGTANAAAFTAAMQAAINAAGAAATPGSRKIVRLKAGTYFVAPQVYPGSASSQVGLYVKVDNVTIRGQGADTTRLAAAGTISNYGTVVLFGHRSGRNDADFAVQAVTADVPRGATTVPVTSAAAYAVGDVVTIDRQDGPATASGAAWLNGGYLWFFDGVYFKRQPTYDWNGPGTGAPAIGNITGMASAATVAQTAVPTWRSTMQTNEVVAIAGNVLTLRDPIHIDFPLSANPQVWRTVPADTSALPLGNRWSGIEDIAVAGGNNLWGFPGGSIAFSYMAYAWARNVEADGERWTNPADPAHPGKYGYNIGVGRSYRCVVRDSYVHGSADVNPGGQAYGIVVGVGSSAVLVENNISVDNNKPIALNSTGGGNVIAYNYVDGAVIWNSPGWQENGIDDCHAAFTHHDLVEGNWTPNIGGDTTHGNSGWHVHLRNYCNGQNGSGGMTGNLRAVGMDGWTHDHAYVGNVLRGGTVYQATPTSTGGRPIYRLGDNSGSDGIWDNGYSLAHVYRDGNWDNVTNGQVWVAGARSIPSSFYLTGKPAFFGSRTWPWVDPAGGVTYVLPAKARYDAGTPNVVP